MNKRASTGKVVVSQLTGNCEQVFSLVTDDHRSMTAGYRHCTLAYTTMNLLEGLQVRYTHAEP